MNTLPRLLAGLLARLPHDWSRAALSALGWKFAENTRRDNPTTTPPPTTHEGDTP